MKWDKIEYIIIIAYVSILIYIVKQFAKSHGVTL